MASKIKLGDRPADFPRTVKFKNLEGAEVTMSVTFKYRTRSEYAAYVDQHFGAARADSPLDITDLSESALAKAADKVNADFLAGLLMGWEFVEPLDAESIAKLCDQYPAAVVALCADYRQAIQEGRTGN